MDKKNVLVFPCGSEIGLEIYRALKHSIHFNLFGGSSVDDHGKYLYKTYIDGIPFVDDGDFIDRLKEVIKEYNIEIIFPTMDTVIHKLSANSSNINCKIASSNLETTEICLSKSKTYKFFDNKIAVPHIYNAVNEIDNYPVFLKPDIGYSGRRTLRAMNKEQAIQHLTANPDCLILEDLPGEEYTIDCFTNKHKELLFCGPRKRNRISNGISVNTYEAEEEIKDELEGLAIKINSLLEFRGAWFFQVKIDKNNEFKLLEVASRLGGSSALFRAKGVNFALLTLWDLLDKNLEIIVNEYKVEMDRALDTKYKINFDYNVVYVDLDDAIIINNKVNEELVAFLYKSINENKRIVLITKHAGDLSKTLTHFRINNLFDKIIHLNIEQEKSDFIEEQKAIFIDDSFKERNKIAEKCGIPVFDINMIDAIL